jgi:hypothetical protein
MVNRLGWARHGVPNLVVAQRVIDKMAKAAQHYLEDETGEAMVGLLVPGAHSGVPTLYILDTIAPDESAVRQWATFQQGDDRQDELVWWLQENWRVCRAQGSDSTGAKLADKWQVPLRYVGDWHKQPGEMIQPSQGDLMTARHWIDDPENGMDFLLAPIVTLGYTASSVGSASSGSNYVAVPQGGDQMMRVDFWYIDRSARDFLPITPSVYPDAQLPALVDYPWHLVHEARFKAEYERLTADGLFATLVLWEADGKPPLDVCFLTARLGAEKMLLLSTPYDYPAKPPTARVAPAAEIQPEADLYAVFESLWDDSQPVPNPPDWTWNENRYLIDYLFALEEALGMRTSATKPPPTDSAAEAQS